MKIFSEFIVLHEDVPMPEEDRFCPNFWKAEDFDSEGDYYYNEIDGRWTVLELTRRVNGDDESTLRVYTFREQRSYEPSRQHIADLKRYIDYKAAGRYHYLPSIHAIKNAAVTSLIVETKQLADYREFLETVHFFLDHTKGVLVNYYDLDAAAFREEFLDERPRQPAH